MADVDMRTETPKLIKFHVLQGLNYVLACAFFAYLAVYGSEAKPSFVSKLWMKLEDPPLNPLERTLLAMFWLCPFCIGLGYISLAKHLESVYGSFLTAFMGGTLTFRVAFTPAQYLTLVIIPVDFGGLLYKLLLLKKQDKLFPKSTKSLLWRVPEKAKRSSLSKLLELESYVFAAYLYALSFVSTDLLLPGYEGSRVAPFSKIFFVTQAVIFVFVVPGLRQGKKAAQYLVFVNKSIVSYFLIKGIFFKGVIPNTMALWILLPYLATLVLDMHLLFWKVFMKHSIFSRYITRRQASSAKYFTMFFAVFITTTSNVWYVCTGTGLASISKTFGGFFDRLAFLPGSEEVAEQVRFLDIMMAGLLFLFAIALEEVLAKKNTAKTVSRIHFVLTLSILVFSFTNKILCNLETSSQWGGQNVIFSGPGSAGDIPIGIHCIYWVVNMFLRVSFPINCFLVLWNLDGPISAWLISMKVPKDTKSHLASTILVQDTVRTAIRRTMIFHGFGVLMFASMANTVFTSGVPAFFPKPGAGQYLFNPQIPHDQPAQLSLFYSSLVIAFTTVIMGNALSTINGNALPLAQALSIVWPLSIWSYLFDSWECIAHGQDSRIAEYLRPLFAKTSLAGSAYLSSVAVVGVGCAVFSLTILMYLKVTKISVYNRKAQAPSDFAEELSFSHKQSYIFHGSMLTFLSSVWMIHVCRKVDVDLIGSMFTEFLFDDLITCIMLMNFGFVVYECKDGLHNRALLSSVTSLKSYWIISGYVLFVAKKLVESFGFSSLRMELLQIVSYLAYNIVIQFQSARTVVQAVYLLRPTFNSNMPAVLKSYSALCKSKVEEFDGGIIGVSKESVESGVVVKKLTKGDPNWKNNWKKCFVNTFGEDALMKNSKCMYPIPMTYDKPAFKAAQRQMSNFARFATLLLGRRVAHPPGVGACGMFEVIENKDVPPTSFFVPGRQFHLRCRHSNSTFFDDAALDVRGIALKLGHDRDESMLDLHMNTGSNGNDFFHVPTYKAFAAQGKAKKQAFLKDNPMALECAIDSARRAPESFTQLHYYSQTCRHFWSLDGKKRYCKFRLVPYGNGPFSGVGPEPFKASEEDQQRIANGYFTDNGRLEGEKREKDYLRKEFVARVESGVVKYRLQVQLYEAKAADTHEVFNLHKRWDAPFLDVGIVTVFAPMVDYETENTSFAVHNTPDCLSFIKPVSPVDYNSLNWIRARIYKECAPIRRFFSLSKPKVFCSPCKYIIDCHTSHALFSGIDGNVHMTLVGTKASTTRLFLENGGHDFQADTVSRFIVYDEDIGEPLCCFVHHDSERSWRKRLMKLDFFVGEKWNCGKIRVTSKSPRYGKKKTTFYMWKWLSKGELGFAVADRIPSTRKAQTVSKLLLKKHFEEKHENYVWTSGDRLPNHLIYENHSELPEEEQFSVPKHRDFLAISMEGLLSQKLVKTFFKQGDFRRLKDYFSLYTRDQPVKQMQDWSTDEELGRQLLSGVHPLWFQRCNSIPENFLVDDEVLVGLLPPGRTLAQEIQAGHVFILDYEILCGIPTSPGAYVATPLALLYASEELSLRPIAIQLNQEGGPVWTPKDKPMDWILAKVHLISADSNCHQMISHLFATHLVIEPWTVAMERTLFCAHPVYKILKPYFVDAIGINTMGRSTLIQPGGIVDRVLSVGGGGHMDLIAKAYSRFKMDALNIPSSLERRGVMDKKVLKDYYWRDDALLLWSAMETFTLAVLRVHYGADADVAADSQLQNLIGEMRHKGYESSDPDHHGVPHAITSISQLADLCTSLLYCSSCQHAAVNFPMYEYYSFIPNRALSLRKPPPTKRGEATEEYICETLPDLEQSALTIATVHALSTFSRDEVFLGQSKVDTMDFPEERKAMKQFQEDLAQIERSMKERNAKLGIHAYRYLMPSKVPSNLAI